MSKELVLVRHGQTEWSLSGQHTGRSDIPLTEEGRRQAGLLREALRRRSFARVLTSPLSRAVDTCQLSGLGEGAEPDDGLLEWDYGEYEGITTPRIREGQPGWGLWRDGCPGGESPAQVGARADRMLESIEGVEGDIALFAHGHILRVIAARWIGLGPEGGGLLALSTATLSALGFERERRVVRLWNAPVG